MGFIRRVQATLIRIDSLETTLATILHSMDDNFGDTEDEPLIRTEGLVPQGIQGQEQRGEVEGTGERLQRCVFDTYVVIDAILHICMVTVLCNIILF